MTADQSDQVEPSDPNGALSQRLPVFHDGSSLWMRELCALLPSLAPEQQSYLLEFAFWSPIGVWQDFILPPGHDAAVLVELEKRLLIERTHDPFIVDRPAHSMWRITGGGHDSDRLFHYHIQSLGPDETSSVFKTVFHKVIRHFPRCDSANFTISSYPAEAWESLPHAARLIKIVTEADFHEALLGQGEEAVRVMIEVVWLTSCIEMMDELLSQGVFPKAPPDDRAKTAPSSHRTRFKDQPAHVAAGS